YKTKNEFNANNISMDLGYVLLSITLSCNKVKKDMKVAEISTAYGNTVNIDLRFFLCLFLPGQSPRYGLVK
ncbi:MAG: hypothetical protein OEZ58_10565, partial [Gammaproteobacteria bacterium]|nr:hypothetical protein [Gammaproteobacteria bacterium]